MSGLLVRPNLFASHVDAEQRWRDELARRPRVRVTPRPGARNDCGRVGSGVLVSDASGRLTIDDTVETRLARLGTELTVEICRMADEEVA